MIANANLDRFISCSDAARELGLTTGRIRQLLLAKQLTGHKFAGLWAIDRRELERFRKKPRKVGNPNFLKK